MTSAGSYNSLVATRFACATLALIVMTTKVYASENSVHSHPQTAPAGPMANTRCNNAPPTPYNPSSTELERDKIYSLLAYAVVYKDWQTDNRRGFNIGSVLVDPNQAPDHQLVCWARNSVGVTKNATQHGEVRLLTNYLEIAGVRSAKGLKLYTTLEPCAMCSGMMTLVSLRTSIYGQTDPRFGKVMERLALDSQNLPEGHCPYPRGVQSVAAQVAIRERLDTAYAAAGKPGITSWLAGEAARTLFEQAASELAGYQVQFAENQRVVDRARAFLAKVPSKYTSLPYTRACEEPWVQQEGPFSLKTMSERVKRWVERVFY